MNFNSWLRSNNILIICTALKGPKRKSFNALMKHLNLKLGSDYIFLDSTTRDANSWKTAMKEVFDIDVTNSIKPFIQPKLYNALANSTFLKAKLGNSLTKARAFKLCETLNKTILLTEDDTCISKELKSFDFSKIPNTWKILYLGHCYSYKDRSSIIQLESGRYYARMKGCSCMHACVVTPEAASKMIKNWIPFRESDETFRKIYQKLKIPTFGIFNPLLYQRMDLGSNLRNANELEQELKNARNKFGSCVHIS